MFAVQAQDWFSDVWASIDNAEKTSYLDSRIATGSYWDPNIAAEPSGMFLGMSDDFLLERARTGKVTRVKFNKGGTSVSLRLDFQDGSRAAYKPAQTNLQSIPRKEVAAYRINRLLGLNAVPPAVPRRMSREEIFSNLATSSKKFLPRMYAEVIFDATGRTSGVASYWIPKLVSSKLDKPAGRRTTREWLKQKGKLPRNKKNMAAQVSNLIIFDYLISNPDRYSGGNMKMSPDGKRLYYMDNTMAFYLDADGNGVTGPVLGRTQKFSRRLVASLDKISHPRLSKILLAGPANEMDILTPSEIRAVVTRRRAIQGHVNRLIRKYGENKVLVFP